MIKRLGFFLFLFSISASASMLCAQNTLSENPDSVVFHTEDISLFWKVFDATSPKFEAKAFQKDYLDAGSPGLKGFIRMRIESGNSLSKTIKKDVSYYQQIRENSLSIDSRKGKIREHFYGLKKIYEHAVFPDVYFVIGVKNSGGTVFKGGLIIGAEMFGKSNDPIQTALDIDHVDDVVIHELVHFQQNYKRDLSLLAQCIKEGSADFICELITGDHSNKSIHAYGDSHSTELWTEFTQEKDKTDWKDWLYQYQGTESRPKDLGYYVGYKIAQAYYNKMDDKTQAVYDILNIRDFKEFLKQSGYNGQY